MEKDDLIDQDVMLYLDFHHNIVKSYCYILDFNSANKQIGKLEGILESNSSKAVYLEYYDTLILYNTHNPSIERSYNNLRQYIDFVEQTRYSISNQEPLIIARNIFRYLIQALKLGKLRENEPTKLLNALNKFGNDFPSIKTYIQLFHIHFKLQEYLDEKLNSNFYYEISNNFEILTDTNYVENIPSISAYCHYMYFLGTQIIDHPEALERLLKLSIKSSEKLISSPYITIFIKNEIIKIVLENKQFGLDSWLRKINKTYSLQEISNIASLYNKFESKIINISNLITELFVDEVYFEKFRIHMEERMELKIQSM